MDSLSLRLRTKCLASPREKTPCPVFRNGRKILPSCDGLTLLTVDGWFHALLNAFYGFFSVFPHGTTALSDFGSSLGLGLDVSRIPTRNSTSCTLDTRHHPSEFPLRDYHPFAYCFPADFASFFRMDTGPNTTFVFHCWIRSVCPLPRSVALTDGISIDFFSCRY